MTQTLLEAKDICYSYNKKSGNVLDHISLKIERGVKTAILGANGAGKSTLFSVLNALYKPDSGEVYYNGEPLSYRKKNILRMRSEVSILFQNPNDMLFRPNVEQDVAYGPENLKLPHDEVQRRVDDALFAVGMSDFKKSPTMRLSYGQRKRITLAGVLAMHPQVLIMDEPTAGLDPQMAYEVMEIAEQLCVNGVTVIMASHDNNLIYSWADDIHVMQNGKCVYSGAPEQFYGDKVAVYQAGLLAPSAFLMNEGLSSIGIVDREPYPKTETEVSAKIAKNRSGKFGTLHIMEIATDSDINALVAEHGLGDLPVGIYGMSARRAQDVSRAKVEFMYNGPESCTMKCMAGQDALVLCDPVMVERAKASAEFINNGGYGDIKVDVIKL